MKESQGRGKQQGAIVYKYQNSKELLWCPKTRAPEAMEKTVKGN